jgi:branched-chain amino acid transport system permease protein
MLGFFGVVIDGLSYGSLLFLMSIGLSITLGVMGFANLCHTAFAMLGGYFTVALMQSAGVPFAAAVPLAVIGATALGVVVERAVFQRVYRRPALTQMLLTLGATMMISASMVYLWGPSLQSITIPGVLQGRVDVGSLDVSRYRLMLFAISVALLVLLLLGVERTRLGTMIRAAVDNQRVAAALGIPIQKVFMTTFAIGTALAALGGSLGVEALGLDPSFALKYLVLALLVVVVGGAGSISGTFVGSMVLGVFDIASKYYAPAIGSFAVYLLMLAVLIIRPQGLRGIKRATA